MVANSDIHLRVRRGEVHALCGENGAGKSTLMKILYGIQQPDEGTITVDGVVTHFRSPADAIEAGIGMVHLVGAPFIGFLGEQFGLLNALLVVLLLMVMAGLAAPAARERSRMPGATGGESAAASDSASDA